MRRARGGDSGDLTIAKHRRPVGDARDFLEPVRDIDDADAPRGDLAHHREQPFNLGGGQRGGRLVHHQDARGVGQRLGDGDDLPPADRKLADRLIDVELDADRLQAGAGRAPHRRTVEHARARQLPPQEQIGGDVEARHEIELLKDRGDARRLRGARIGEAHGRAVDAHFAGVGLDDAGENVHQRRLAGAVFAEQRMNLPAMQIEVHATERLNAAEALDDAGHGKQRRRRFDMRVHRGLAQESRSLRAASRRTVRRAPSGAAIRSISRNAARLPISSQGWAIKVSRGSKQSAHSKSSKPAIEMSSGTVSPRARMARIAPIVAILLPVTIAVGGSGSDRSAWVASAALAVEALPVTR